MTLQEFLKFRPNCISCGEHNLFTMNGQLQEKIDNSFVHSFFSYSSPAIRKKFITFSLADLAILCIDKNIDIDTLNKNKYNTFVLNNNIVSFDEDFVYTMRLTFSVACPERHYVYKSRPIKISNVSPDITKGYPVFTEELNLPNYKVISNLNKKITSIYRTDVLSADKIDITYINISDFPTHDLKACVKKIENILILA